MKRGYKAEPGISPLQPSTSDTTDNPRTSKSSGARNRKAGTIVPRTGKGATVVNSGASNDVPRDLCAQTGTDHNAVSNRIVKQVYKSLYGATPKDPETVLLEAMNAIRELSPNTLTEAMLAVQTIATHEAALTFLQRALLEGQSIEGADSNVLRATRLMRLHLEQIEAMLKLKGKTGQQKVTVKHVHVYQGGQAIVGAVSNVREGGE